MIATALTFLLGVFVTLVAALLAAPILWRKAQGFARREFEATIPVSANEIRAEFDKVRAEAAMAVRRQEIASREMGERVTAARAELGRAHVELAALTRREREMEREMAAFSAERDNFRRTFATYRGEPDEARKDGSLNAEELEALAGRFGEMSDLAEDRQVELVAAHARIERLSDALRAAERASLEKETLIRVLRHEAGKTVEERPRAVPRAGVIPGLSAKIAEKAVPVAAPEAKDARGEVGAPSLRDVLQRSHVADRLTPEEGARIRERIADVATQVIYRTALAEGEGSPLAALLHPVEGAAPAAQGAPSLADRVRRLAAADQSGEIRRRPE